MYVFPKNAAMICLEVIREHFIEMDMDLGLMEEAYSTFARFKIEAPKEEVERVESLRFNFTNMVNHSKKVQEDICNVQGPLLEELTKGRGRKIDEDFDERGPMIPGLSAREASDRVLAFQDRFDELWRRFEMYSSGERLFGLDVNDYPILHKRKKEFNLLNKLYSLYLSVNHSIDGYFDLLWSDVDTEVIFAELTDFQNSVISRQLFAGRMLKYRQIRPLKRVGFKNASLKLHPYLFYDQFKGSVYSVERRQINVYATIDCQPCNLQVVVALKKPNFAFLLKADYTMSQTSKGDERLASIFWT
ncbi:hypothetical protein NQ317_010572 [Molorchus minor]|uniref:Uncharacterized protein n=1 Tax=Molorchus minor TaxID=1323400 RepID=A0ABQ9IRJ0_9CUCU|nr:hypothetical protein NQ317_010572 [Molorchus minor]